MSAVTIGDMHQLLDVSDQLYDALVGDCTSDGFKARVAAMTAVQAQTTWCNLISLHTKMERIRSAIVLGVQPRPLGT